MQSEYGWLGSLVASTQAGPTKHAQVACTCPNVAEVIVSPQLTVVSPKFSYTFAPSVTPGVTGPVAAAAMVEHPRTALEMLPLLMYTVVPDHPKYVPALAQSVPVLS